jgi:pSer/pThr/pTyr-binding forkhead associated (FHA) protein
MKTVTFQVVVGVDKGRVFRDLPIPVTIGREEGNVLRLNDERISRFHAKVQVDNGDVILTDLDSTNGTRINGHTVQIRRIQPGDRLGIGRSILLFGSNEEIAARIAAQGSDSKPSAGPAPFIPKPSDRTQAADPADLEADFDDTPDPFWAASDHNLPELPQKLTPSQAARLSEILDYLHRGLSSATEELDVAEDTGQVTIKFGEWQKIQAVEMLLARYLRAISEPDALVE